MERQIQVFATGVGMRIQGTGFGLNVQSGVHMAIRESKSDRPVIITVADSFSLGSHSGSIGGSGIQTEWFTASTEICPWLKKPRALFGKTLSMELKGAVLLGWGDVDFTIIKHDSHGHRQKILDIGAIPASGFQLAGTGARGVAKERTPWVDLSAAESGS